MITLIAFVGSVFSPYYRRAYRKGVADPLNYCSLNIALYGSVNRWCMTERPVSNIAVSENNFTIGPSSVDFEHQNNQAKLIFTINEKSAPLPRAVQGRVIVDISNINETVYTLADGHQWWPVAPNSAVEVSLDHPALNWRGHAYVDSNQGVRPLENDINSWSWARYRKNNCTHIHYDVDHEDGGKHSVSTCINDQGVAVETEPPTMYPLKRTRWLLQQQARSEEHAPVVHTRMEDTPFYARSAIRATIEGQNTEGIHETVSLERFKQPVVQAMLHFRMPRWSGKKYKV